MRRRRGRALRRRYGRTRAHGHLPLSRLSLSEYEREVDASIRFGARGAETADERMIVLRGWHAGQKPVVTALAIEKNRRGR